MEFTPFMQIALIAGVVLLVIMVGIAMLIAKFYRKVDQGHALIVNKLKGKVNVSFTGAIVVPILYRVEEMDISVKKIEIDRRGSEGLICADNIRADIKVTFFVNDDCIICINNLGDHICRVTDESSKSRTGI